MVVPVDVAVAVDWSTVAIAKPPPVVAGARVVQPMTSQRLLVTTEVARQATRNRALGASTTNALASALAEPVQYGDRVGLPVASTNSQPWKMPMMGWVVTFVAWMIYFEVAFAFITGSPNPILVVLVDWIRYCPEV